MTARTIRSLVPGAYVLKEAQVRVDIERGRFSKVMRMNGRKILLIGVVLREDNQSWDVTYTLNGTEVHDVLIMAAT